MRRTGPILLCLLPLSLWAQHVAQPQSPLMQVFMEEEQMGSGLRTVHHTIRPLVQHAQFAAADSAHLMGYVRADPASRPGLHKLQSMRWWDYRKGKVGIEWMPIIHAVGGGGSSSGAMADMAGGFRGSLRVGRMLRGHISIRGGAMRGPAHQRAFMDSMLVRPGYGEYYRWGDLYGFFDPRGSISFAPSENFNLQAGHDQLFIGNGFRSLMLSDNAAPFSFFKIDTRFWRVRYVSIFANFKDIRPDAVRNKLGSVHYLSINLHKRITVGFYEGITWMAEDSTGSRGFEPNYLNPIIFYRPVEMSLRSPDRVMLGMDLRVRIGKNHHLYGQVVIDEFKMSEVFARFSSDTSKQIGWWGNKQAFQVGLKGWSPFRIRNLYYQGEFNWVRPFTYTHKAVEQNHGHRNQSLAHPLGANFIEAIGILRYRAGNWLMEGKFVYANFGADTAGAGSYGQNIYRPYTERERDYGNYMIQGLDTKVYFGQLRVEYVLNPFWNFRVMGGVSMRAERSALASRNDVYGFIGISTDLSRLYDDF